MSSSLICLKILLIQKENYISQDSDPSQNSKIAREAMNSFSCRLFKITPRSPDLKSDLKYYFTLLENKLKNMLLLITWYMKLMSNLADGLKREI